MKKLQLEISVNAEGDNLATLNNKSGGYRMAGPKAWGGSRALAAIEVDPSEIIAALNSCGYTNASLGDHTEG